MFDFYFILKKAIFSFTLRRIEYFTSNTPNISLQFSYNQNLNECSVNKNVSLNSNENLDEEFIFQNVYIGNCMKDEKENLISKSVNDNKLIQITDQKIKLDLNNKIDELNLNSNSSIKIFNRPSLNKNDYFHLNTILTENLLKFKDKDDLNIFYILKLFYLKELYLNIFKENHFYFSFDFIDDEKNMDYLFYKDILQSNKYEKIVNISKDINFVLPENEKFNYIKIISQRISPFIKNKIESEFDLNCINYKDNNFKNSSFFDFSIISNEYTENHLNYRELNSNDTFNKRKIIYEDILGGNYAFYKDYNIENNINNISNSYNQESNIDIDEEERLLDERSIIKNNLIDIQKIIKNLYKDCFSDFDISNIGKNSKNEEKLINGYIINCLKNNNILIKILSSDKNLSYKIESFLIKKNFEYILKLSEKLKEKENNKKNKRDKKDNDQNNPKISKISKSSYDYLELLKIQNYFDNQKNIINFNKYYIYTSKPECFLKFVCCNHLNFISFNTINTINNIFIRFIRNHKYDNIYLDPFESLKQISKNITNEEILNNILKTIEEKIFKDNSDNKGYSENEIYNYKIINSYHESKIEIFNKKNIQKNSVSIKEILFNLSYFINKSNNNKIINDSSELNIEKRFNFLFEMNFSLKNICNDSNFFLFIITQLINKNNNLLNIDEIEIQGNKTKENILMTKKINNYLNSYLNIYEKKKFLVTLKDIIYEFYLNSIIKQIKKNQYYQKDSIRDMHKEINLETKFLENHVVKSEDEEIKFLDKNQLNNIDKLNIEKERENMMKESSDINISKNKKKVIEVKNIDSILFEIFNWKFPYSFIYLFEKVNFLKKFIYYIKFNNLYSAVSLLKTKYSESDFSNILKFCFFIIVNLLDYADLDNEDNPKRANYNILFNQNLLFNNINDKSKDLLICDLINVIENPKKYQKFLCLFFKENNYCNQIIKNLNSDNNLNCQIISYLVAIEKFNLFSFSETKSSLIKKNKTSQKEVDRVFEIEGISSEVNYKRVEKLFFKICLGIIIFNHNTFQNYSIEKLLDYLNIFSVGLVSKYENYNLNHKEKINLFFLIIEFFKDYFSFTDNVSQFNINNSAQIKDSYNEFILNKSNNGKKNLKNNFFKFILFFLQEIITEKEFNLNWFEISLIYNIKFSSYEYSKIFRNFYFDESLISLSSKFCSIKKKTKNLLIYNDTKQIVGIEKEKIKLFLENIFFIGNSNNKILLKDKHFKNEFEKENMILRNLVKEDLFEYFYYKNNFELRTLLENFLKTIISKNFDFTTKENKENYDLNENVFSITELAIMNLFKENTIMPFKYSKLNIMKYEFEKKIIKNDSNGIYFDNSNLNESLQLCSNLISILFLIISKNKDKSLILEVLSNLKKQEQIRQNKQNKKFSNFLTTFNANIYNIYSFFLTLRLFLLNQKLIFLISLKSSFNKIEGNKPINTNKHSISNNNSILDKIKKELEIINAELIKISIFNFFEDLLINPEKEPQFLELILTSIENNLANGTYNYDVIESFFLFLNFENDITFTQIKKTDNFDNNYNIFSKKKIISEKYYEKIINIKNIIKVKIPIYFENNNRKSEVFRKLLEDRIIKKVDWHNTMENLHFILINNHEEYSNFYKRFNELIFLDRENKINTTNYTITNTYFFSLEGKDYKKNAERIKFNRLRIKKEFSDIKFKLENKFFLSDYFNIQNKHINEDYLNIPKEKKNFILNILSKHFTIEDIPSGYKENNIYKKYTDVIDYLTKNVKFSDENNLNYLENNCNEKKNLVKLKIINENEMKINDILITDTNPNEDKLNSPKIIKLETNYHSSEKKQSMFNSQGNSEGEKTKLVDHISSEEIPLEDNFLDLNLIESHKILENFVDNFSQNYKGDDSSYFKYLKPMIKIEETTVKQSYFKGENSNKSEKNEKIIKKKYIAIKIIFYLINRITLKNNFDLFIRNISKDYLNNDNSFKNRNFSSKKSVSTYKKNIIKNASVLENIKNKNRNNINDGKDLFVNNQGSSYFNSFLSKNETMNNLILSNDSNKNEESINIYEIIDNSKIKQNTICNTINMGIYNYRNSNYAEVEVEKELLKKPLIKDLNKEAIGNNLNHDKYHLLGKSLYPKLMKNIKKFK